MQKAATTRDKWVVFTLFVAVVAVVVLTVKFSLSMVQMAGLYTLFESIQDNVSDANISEGIRHSTVKGSPLKSIDGWPPADTDLHEQSRFVFHADRSVDTKYPKSIQANDKMASPAKAHSFPQDRVHEDHSGAPFRHKSTPQLLAECGVHLLESVPISCQQFASVL